MLCARSETGLLAVRLEPGDDVHASLRQACELHGVSAAYVVSGIGMLAEVELGFLTGPGEYARKLFPGDHELLSLAGNVAPYSGELLCHLHVSLSGHDYSAFGGHLFSARAAITVEVLVLPLGGGVELTRELDQTTLLPTMQIRPLG